jgi:hypothetical protein
MKKIELLNKLSSGKYVLSVSKYGFKDTYRIFEVSNIERLQTLTANLKLKNNIMLETSQAITERLFNSLNLSNLKKFNTELTTNQYFYQSIK